MLTESRKTDHIAICLEKQVETADPLWQDVRLVHTALPELSFDTVDTSCSFFGKKLSVPLLIAGITGGCAEARAINRCLASAAERCGIAFGVGSQRAMIEKPDLVDTYAVRDIARNTLLFGNIGITALQQYPSDAIIDAVREIGADAVCVHINAAQELFQAEGDRDFSGCVSSLEAFCHACPVPVVAKEVGNGFSRECALQLQRAGVAAIDTGGLGGTSWVLIDSIRSGMDASLFQTWGIPTAVSVVECRVGLPVIATGGIRTGVDIAKALALGADVCGIALPFLRIADREGSEGVVRYIGRLQDDLARVMFLTGCATVPELRNARCDLRGAVLESAEKWHAV